MHRRRIRRLGFFALVLLFPWPLPFLGGAFVPSIRFWILGGAAASVGLTEGASGAGLPLIGLLLGWASITTGFCWLAAFALARLADALPDRRALLVTYSAITCGLIWALLFQPYRTPFGRALHGGLLQVLS